MFNLYFKDVYSVLTLVFLAGMIIYIVLAIKNRNRIEKWGKKIALFIGIGMAISFLSAMRDAFASPGAVFAMNSMQSLVCSIAGGLIFLTGIVSIFLKNQMHKKYCYFTVSVLFAVQVLVVEISRPIMML